MNEVSKTECAPYDKQQDWNAINWREIRKHVRRLQNRIAKAIRNRIVRVILTRIRL